MNRDREDVLAALPDNFARASEIWKMVGKWSLTSVKHELNALAAEGLVERKLVTEPKQSPYHVYRRAAPQ